MVAEAPDMGDLATTEDVQITPEIEALAQELEHNPSKIYNWVHNNIQFIPTYGSIQGSQMTLESQRGNAIDTASLLIALLRASGIHSRYAYGTVQIPIEQVMNWTGNINIPEMAIQLLASGGIPVTALTQSGQIAFVKMEHVWVEAWVDFFPSRGANHVTGDTWVSMDASFKQYTFSEGIQFEETIPFDVNSLVDDLWQTAQVNETQGWVTGIDSQVIRTSLDDYRTQWQTYLDEHHSEATLADILDKKAIIPTNRQVLATGLPYQLVARGNTFKTIPDDLRHSITLKFFDSTFDQSWDNPSLSYTLSLPALNSQRLGVTYEPATESDAQALESFRATDTGTLPAYMFNLKPVIKLDDVVLSTGSVIRMGESQYYTMTLKNPRDTHAADGIVTVGDEIVFGINGNGLPLSVVQKRFDTVNSNTAAENLHQTALHFWAEHDFFDDLTAQAHQVKKQRMPSAGLFSTPLSVTHSFGIAREGIYKSRLVDVPLSILTVVAENDQARFDFMSQIGTQASYLEGSVNEQLFGYTPGRGLSATQLLMEANDQNIPIYTVTQDNLSHILPQLAVSSEIRTDVINSVHAGKQAR
jgi:hypothetical protein